MTTEKQKAKDRQKSKNWYWKLSKRERKARRHKTNLRRRGLSVEQYATLLAKQNGVCAICRHTCKTGWRLAVDHDHETGKVRGLLCCNCNHALGKMADDPVRLRAAAEYLERAS